jgi:hypothetical protein
MTRRRSGKPIDPVLHGRIDWAFMASNLLVPTLLQTSGKARGLFAAFAANQGGLNAITAPYGAKKIVPFATHGLIERNSGLVYLILPLAIGLGRETKARAYWLAAGAALVTVYNLTDWRAPASVRGSAARRKRH